LEKFFYKTEKAFPITGEEEYFTSTGIISLSLFSNKARPFFLSKVKNSAFSFCFLKSEKDALKKWSSPPVLLQQ